MEESSELVQAENKRGAIIPRTKIAEPPVQEDDNATGYPLPAGTP
jgi:hypothetical protein